MDSVFAPHTHNRQRSEMGWIGWVEPSLLLLVHDGLGSPDSASPAGGDETDLLTGGAATAHSGGLADMLVVTTTVGMLNGVHSHTSHLNISVRITKQNSNAQI